jgi:hypothetical protein
MVPIVPLPLAPAAGSMQAFFAAPPGSQNLRQVRDPDVLWEFIDETREALMESKVMGQVLHT